jgi:hypothetical protein
MWEPVRGTGAIQGSGPVLHFGKKKLELRKYGDLTNINVKNLKKEI